MLSKFIWTLAGLLLTYIPGYAHELVEISKIDHCICIHLRNPVYPECSRAYLVRQVAKQLSRVQKELEKDCVTLVVLDAYRPFSYAHFFETPYSFRSSDESNPVINGHYRGTAVDVTIAYQDGQPLQMPPFFNTYDLQALALETDYPGFSCESYHNLQKLQKAMEKHRFVPSSTEWWHFDYKDWFQYPTLDVSFEELHKE